MKDLQELGKSFTPAKQFKKDDVIIDEFAKNIIDKVFEQLSIIFPAWKHNWKSDDPNNPDRILNLAKMEWTKAFNENGINTLEQVKFGFMKARRSESDFLPSCGKFISWCTPSAEDLGYPSEHNALRECQHHRRCKGMFEQVGSKINTRPFILELCKRVDWWLIEHASTQTERNKADKHFNEEYVALIRSGYQEPEVTEHERLETKEVVRERMTPEQEAEERKKTSEFLKEMRERLNKKPD